MKGKVRLPKSQFSGQEELLITIDLPWVIPMEVSSSSENIIWKTKSHYPERGLILLILKPLEQENL